MTVPAQVAKLHNSPVACIEQESEIEVNAGDGPSNHLAQMSAEKTGAALLALYDHPVEAWAATVLWYENRETIEREMTTCLPSPSDAGLRERVLSGMASQARFFCLEVDDPKVWVARCANLESRRVALTLKK
jgi:hypothetical protein